MNKVMKFKTIRGLSRIIARNYSSNFECCLMQDITTKDFYLLGFSQRSFPSSNKDDVIYRVTVRSEYEILEQITYYEEDITITSGKIIGCF
jgi:hypothetical protein